MQDFRDVLDECGGLGTWALLQTNLLGLNIFPTVQLFGKGLIGLLGQMIGYYVSCL